MLLILQFIFSSFWTWIGTLLLLYLPYMIVYSICSTILQSLKIKYQSKLLDKGNHESRE